jgi:hypothetical protein
MMQSKSLGTTLFRRMLMAILAGLGSVRKFYLYRKSLNIYSYLLSKEALCFAGTVNSR